MRHLAPPGDVTNGRLDIALLAPRSTSAADGAGGALVDLAGHPTPTLAELENVIAGLRSGSRVAADIVTANGDRTTVDIVLDQLSS